MELTNKSSRVAMPQENAAPAFDWEKAIIDHITKQPKSYLDSIISQVNYSHPESLQGMSPIDLEDAVVLPLVKKMYQERKLKMKYDEQRGSYYLWVPGVKSPPQKAPTPEMIQQWIQDAAHDFFYDSGDPKVSEDEAMKALIAQAGPSLADAIYDRAYMYAREHGKPL